MRTVVNLNLELFGKQPKEVYRDADFTVTAFMFPDDIAALALQNRRGTLTLLPYQGLTVWDVNFDGHSLKSAGDCALPRRDDISGCFAYHEGLPDDRGPLVKVWLEVENGVLIVRGSNADGACRTQPAVELQANSAQFNIEMVINNLADRAQPLNYLCHMNYACDPDAVFRQNLLGCALNIRDNPQPLICSDDLSLYVDHAEFYMLAPRGRKYVTRFSTGQLNYAVLHRPRSNPQAAAFIQPASYSPAAAGQKPVMINAGEMREFRVTTGVL